MKKVSKYLACKHACASTVLMYLFIYCRNDSSLFILLAILCTRHVYELPLKSWEFYSITASTHTHIYSFNISFIFLRKMCVCYTHEPSIAIISYCGLGNFSNIKNVTVLHCSVQEKLSYLFFFNGC